MSWSFFDWRMQIFYSSPMEPTYGRKFICRLSPMSKTHLSILFFAVISLVAMSISTSAQGLAVDIDPDWERARVEVLVSGFPGALPPVLSFPSRIASVSFASDRIVSVELSDGQGPWMEARRLSPFVFSVSEGISAVRLIVAVGIQEDPFSNPYVSWMKDGATALILSDLLPLEFNGPVSVRISGESQRRSFDRVESAVVTASGETGAWKREGGLRMGRIGEWPIEQDVAFSVVREILSHYSERIGSLQGGLTEILLVRVSDTPGRWSARTVGSTVILFSSGMPFQSQEVQRFHEQMRHELFHLWIPNSLGIQGDYATFYEGFALYQSLKSGVALGRIRFTDFMSTLSSAIGISTRVNDAPIQSAQWGDDRESLYASGLVSAFATDVSLIASSGGRESSETFLRGFIATNRSRQVSAPFAIRERFDLYEGLRRYGVGSDLMLARNALVDALRLAGLQHKNGIVAVVDKPTGAQRKVLDRLGYNTRAPKIQIPIR
jgi:hypothetical protein